MRDEKQSMQQSGTAGAVQPSSAAGATHNVFLNLRIEPFFSSSIMDMLDILVYPVTMSPSVPSTPPPTYEPPPPSYPSSETWSVSSMSTFSLDRLADAISTFNDNDSAISAECDPTYGRGDTCSSIANSIYSLNASNTNIFGSSNSNSGNANHTGASSNSSGSGGTGAGAGNIAGPPGLQRQLFFNLAVYELLSGRQKALSRSTSMDSVV
ncbi:hypothetical protein IW140_000741 [Coemansia sp. RSA 1813]|nr:hypothetical protein EV178_000753 [Coemansia sp. RSA 1646]KAJ1773610.1 hypothetical protein LPJ74_000526 [Coemansia sp. RSA 1843]KAJ2092374.1 hypothetical protein IW138_001136 [Coemansia sp. RSA 986]KAJ2217400.1 hypothetical protein EV179_000550 [Coemansia sp. RSA 487]KAJ2572626.1 hypothetical protein IW140_000741 [Coemansia sp. RSA 1813]